MTREEAIKSLQNIVEYWTYKPTEVEAAKMAISALRPVSREQVEKVWKGEWVVQMDGNGYLYKNMLECSRCKTTHIGHPNVGRFCPHCGAPMTDEAVDMVMERLEAMKDAGD